MKLAKIIFGVIVAIVISLIFIYKPAHAPMAEMPDVVPETEHYCYVYKQLAEPNAPYSVEEHIDLTLTGMKAEGKKTGTQSGPDMTNGYFGTLTGSRNGPSLELVYSYTVEGSQNKEREIYLMKGDSLVKHRYTLHEEDGMLVPDMNSEPKDMVYNSEPCAP